MHRMTWYVVGELLKVFFVTLTGMTVLLIMVGVVREAAMQGLGPKPIVRLLPYLLPNALRFAVPGTMLFATCMVFGRISAANEIVAIKSIGVSPVTLLWPALVVAFLVSLAAVWLNDLAACWGRKGIHRVVLQSVEQIAYGMLRTQRSYTTRQFSINVMRVEGRKLIHLTLSFYSPKNDSALTLTAEEAELRFNPANDSLSLVLLNSEVDWGEKWTGRFPGTTRHEIPLAVASRRDESGTGPSEFALRQIGPEVTLQKQEIQQADQTLAAASALSLTSGQWDQLAGSTWASRQRRRTDARIRLFRLYTEPWRRWANGFSCFCFVLVGAPLAIRLRNSDFWTSFGLCFLPILIVYYPLLIYGVDRAKCGALPPYSVWLGNLLLVAAGLWASRRLMRY